MESGPSPFIPFFLGLAITAGLLVPLLLRLRSSVGEARAEKASAGQQISPAQAQTTPCSRRTSASSPSS